MKDKSNEIKLSDNVRKMIEVENLINLIRIDARNKIDKQTSMKEISKYHESKGLTEQELKELYDRVYLSPTVPTVLLGDGSKPDEKKIKEQEEFDRLIQQNNIYNDKLELSGVYDVITKWYHMKDFKRVDVLLASSLSVCACGCDPMMVIFCGNSGDWKSEGLRALARCNLWINEFNKSNTGKPRCIRTVDQLTKNTFVSGKPSKKGRNDLGSELDGKYTLLLITDFANIVSKIKEDKNEIFSQLRNLFDGFLQKDTGSGVKKFYEDCHVTLLANATPMIKDEFYLHQALGTRELIFDTSDSMTEKEQKKESIAKSESAWKNQDTIEQARLELTIAFTKFLIQHPYKEINDDLIPINMKDFIIEQAYALSLLRATIKIDFYRNTVIGEPVVEVPTRLVHQFKLLYKSLKSLYSDYQDEKIKTIIKHFVKSSCPPLRYKLLNKLMKSNEKTFTANELSDDYKIDYKQVRLELDILWSLNLVERRRIGQTQFETQYQYRFKSQNKFDLE